MRSDAGSCRPVALTGVLLIVSCLNGQAQSARGGQTGKAEGGIANDLRRFRIYPHLDRAYRLISRNQLAEAKLELEACLELDGKDAAIWSTYFDVLYRLKAFDRLVARYDELGELAGTLGCGSTICLLSSSARISSASWKIYGRPRARTMASRRSSYNGLPVGSPTWRELRRSRNCCSPFLRQLRTRR